MVQLLEKMTGREEMASERYLIALQLAKMRSKYESDAKAADLDKKGTATSRLAAIDGAIKRLAAAETEVNTKKAMMKWINPK